MNGLVVFLTFFNLSLNLAIRSSWSEPQSAPGLVFADCIDSPSLAAKNIIIPIPKRGDAKECSNYRTIALISHASKVMLKILQARLQQYMNCELSDVQAGFRKGRGTRDQIANTCWIMEKARDFQKKHLSLLY